MLYWLVAPVNRFEQLASVLVQYRRDYLEVLECAGVYVQFVMVPIHHAVDYIMRRV